MSSSGPPDAFTTDIKPAAMHNIDPEVVVDHGADADASVGQQRENLHVFGVYDKDDIILEGGLAKQQHLTEHAHHHTKLLCQFPECRDTSEVFISPCAAKQNRLDFLLAAPPLGVQLQQLVQHVHLHRVILLQAKL